MFTLADDFAPLLRGLVLTSGAVLWTLLLVRIVGLRSFSKMTAFDFVATIATGSLIAQAGTRSSWTDYLNALAAIAGVFLIQWALARLRKASPAAKTLMKNNPVLLMEDGRMIEEALEQTRVSRDSILEKARGANVGSLADVKAAVLETTGDISIMYGENFDASLLAGVRRVSDKQG